MDGHCLWLEIGALHICQFVSAFCKGTYRNAFIVWNGVYKLLPVVYCQTLNLLFMCINDRVSNELNLILLNFWHNFIWVLTIVVHIYLLKFHNSFFLICYIGLCLIFLIKRQFGFKLFKVPWKYENILSRLSFTIIYYIW